MNGEVISFNPKAFYTYEEFKALPEEYQVKYINSLLNRYNCSLVAISTYVFDMSRNTLNNHLRKTNQLQYVNIPKVHWRELKPGDEALRAAVASARKIQNGSNEAEIYEVPKELSIQEKIEQAQDTVDLYLSRGMQITPMLINQIYEEKTGMSFAMALDLMTSTQKERVNVLQKTEEKSAEPKVAREALGTVTKKEETEDGVKFEAELSEKGKEFFARLERDANYPEVTREESTNVSDFYVVMDKLDFGFMASVRDMFKGKKIRVTLRVEIDE